MIPLKLELKNFMAYGEPEPLDFSNLHVVALVGENGAGKSTLLDAMTWALWGQARAKRDDELIRQGTSEMRVAFTFQEGQHIYQVIRVRRLNKATKGRGTPSTGTLEFFIRTPNSTWNQLTEPRMADTQEKIIRTLNLSYETFINSAYLKQGRADEFTLKPPAQRKAVLSEILNLDIWAAYEEQAKARIASLEAEQSRIQLELTRVEAEMARLPEYENQLREAQSAAEAAQRDLQAAEAEMTEIERTRERGRALRAQLSQAEDRLRTVRADRDALNAKRKQHQAALGQYEQALQQRQEIELGYAELEQARQLNETFNSKLASLTALNERKFKAEAAINDAWRVAQGELEAACRRMDELQRLMADQELTPRLKECDAQIAQLERAQSEREALQQDLSTLREQQAALRAHNETLHREMLELKARIEALSKVGAICPACGRELAEDDRARLLAEWRAQGTERGNTYRANEAQAKQLSEQREQLETRIAEISQSLRQLPALQREHTTLTERIARAQEAAAQLPAARTVVDDLRARLEAQEFAREAQDALAQVMADLAALGYDAEAHRRLREDIQTRLLPFAERKAQLERAAFAIESEHLAIQALDGQIQALAQRAEEETKAIEDLRAQIAMCDQALRREPAVAQALAQAREAFFRAQRRVGEANQRVQSALALQHTRVQLEAELAAAKGQQSLLEELRTAFGKNGVPAMIIESVLPELEASANALLARMTSGRMYVRFETQRLTQKGEASETLEIRISDELGERPYELFSGGEAFRVNFAIRIALSRLLAHRANARLQALFIDEGFGTQDAQGRERLIEAIKAIEEDFERIFVITHIDELKDAFPSRIEVQKTARGSVARVI